VPNGTAEIAMNSDRSFIIIGGAGFIGSHFVDRLMGDAEIEKVTIFDNFSSGKEWHYAHHRGDPRLRVIRGDAKDFAALKEVVGGHDVLVHLASNPDIARAITEPDVDFHQGTLLTHNVVEAMRQTGVRRLIYASGSGVYGDIGETEADEGFGPLVPISTYAASKLAGEALISAYSHMFGMTSCAFRFGNVVGPRQTHGVGFDFVRKLMATPDRLQILGDGSQSKSYVYVEDILSAVMLAHARAMLPYQVYNVATGDYLTVREIAGMAVNAAGLDPLSVTFDYTGGDRGWKGDVPVVRLNTDRIRALGWTCNASAREALRRSLANLVSELARR
jgi:UDP-glucose 4-epimerase